MVINTEKKKRIRPSKGLRKHNRLVKQKGRKANLSEEEIKKLLLRK